MFVLPRGWVAAMMDRKLTTLKELNGIMYDVLSSMTSLSGEVTHVVVPVTAREDIHIHIWNCRGIRRASFLPNVYTMTLIIESTIVVLTSMC